MITNYLSPISFTVTIERLPNVEFFTQRTSIPGINNVPVERPSPIHRLYNTPDRVEFTELDLSFIVDEQMQNYIEIFDWMVGMGSPDSTDQFKDLEKSKYGLTSDITIIIHNSNRNPNIKVTYLDCFPTSLSPINLDVTGSDVVYPECSVSFRYNSFKIEKFS